MTLHDVSGTFTRTVEGRARKSIGLGGIYIGIEGLLVNGDVFGDKDSIYFPYTTIIRRKKETMESGSMIN